MGTVPPLHPSRIGKRAGGPIPQLLKAGSTVVSDGCVGQTVVRDRRVYTVGSCSPVGEVVQHTGELGRWWVGPGPLGARLARAQARVLPEHLAAKTGSQTYLQRKPNQVEVINGVKPDVTGSVW